MTQGVAPVAVAQQWQEFGFDRNFATFCLICRSPHSNRGEIDHE
jgi:hypothetical protein